MHTSGYAVKLAGHNPYVAHSRALSRKTMGYNMGS